MSERREEFRPAQSTLAAAWVQQSLCAWPDERGGVPVCALVPTGFAAYARLFHSASKKGDATGARVRWQDLARSGGRAANPEMQWERMVERLESNGAPIKDLAMPEIGTLSRCELHDLGQALACFTATDVIWCGIWSGYGELERYSGAPEFALPNREYFLFTGTVDVFEPGATGAWPFQSPNIWWPDDRAWCVATDIDLMSTYIGGTEDCISQLERLESLEIMRTSPDARVDLGGDV